MYCSGLVSSRIGACTPAVIWNHSSTILISVPIEVLILMWAIVFSTFEYPCANSRSGTSRASLECEEKTSALGKVEGSFILQRRDEIILEVRVLMPCGRSDVEGIEKLICVK